MTAELIVRTGDPVLARLERACQELAQAKTIQEAKQIHDLASAAEVYVRQQQLGDESIAFAHAIKIEALRRLGHILQSTDLAKGGRPSAEKTSARPEPVFVESPTLADLGLTKKASALAQRIAELPPEQFDQVRAGRASVAQAIREVQYARRPTIALPVTGTFRVLYADPPWAYSNSGVINAADNYGRAARHYPTMPLEALCALPVHRLADDDAVLFLWVTAPLVPEGLAVIEGWGFTYKTQFVWDKVRHNFGHYNSVRHELLFIGTRGCCTPDVRTLHDSVVAVERSRVHSEKPEAFRAIIDELYPRGARIELFARRPAPAPWQTWGNEGQAAAS